MMLQLPHASAVRLNVDGVFFFTFSLCEMVRILYFLTQVSVPFCPLLQRPCGTRPGVGSNFAAQERLSFRGRKPAMGLIFSASL